MLTFFSLVCLFLNPATNFVMFKLMFSVQNSPLTIVSPCQTCFIVFIWIFPGFIGCFSGIEVCWMQELPRRSSVCLLSLFAVIFMLNRETILQYSLWKSVCCLDNMQQSHLCVPRGVEPAAMLAALGGSHLRWSCNQWSPSDCWDLSVWTSVVRVMLVFQESLCWSCVHWGNVNTVHTVLNYLSLTYLLVFII